MSEPIFQVMFHFYTPWKYPLLYDRFCDGFFFFFGGGGGGGGAEEKWNIGWKWINWAFDHLLGLLTLKGLNKPSI